MKITLDLSNELADAAKAHAANQNMDWGAVFRLASGGSEGIGLCEEGQ